MIPTTHKDRNPSKEPYVMKASEVSDLLLGVPQYDDLILCFIYYSTPDYRDVIHGKSDSSIEVFSVAYRENYMNNPYELYSPWYVCISSLTMDKKSIVREMIQGQKEQIIKACKLLYNTKHLGRRSGVNVYYSYCTNTLEINCYQDDRDFKI